MVPSMPGVFNFSVEHLVKEAREVRRLGIPAVTVAQKVEISDGKVRVEITG
jgi:delta-aminolevulinic acid dehydratase/porphobilinogen synthase